MALTHSYCSVGNVLTCTELARQNDACCPPKDSSRLARYLAPLKHSSRSVGSLETVRSRTNSRSDCSSSRSRCEVVPGCDVLAALQPSMRARFAAWPATAPSSQHEEMHASFHPPRKNALAPIQYLSPFQAETSCTPSCSQCSSSAAWPAMTDSECGISRYIALQRLNSFPFVADAVYCMVCKDTTRVWHA